MATWRGRAALLTTALVGIALIMLALRPTVGICKDLDRLGQDAATGFDATRDELIDAPSGEWSTSLGLTNTSDCSVYVDPARALYVCQWEYPLGDPEAESQYDSLSKRVAECVGNTTSEQADARVNHPDLWASTYFATPYGEVSVSLKDKNALGRSFVTVGIDAVIPP